MTQETGTNMDNFELRRRQEKVEHSIASFLDKHFYKQSIFTEAKRCYNKEQQVKGTDIVISIPSLGIKDAVVDEKVAITKVNCNLKTFSLELWRNDRRGVGGLGWLMSPDIITEYYLFQWLKADVDNYLDINEHNITEIEVMLVPKKAIVERLKKDGYTYDKVLEVINLIRSGKGAEYLSSYKKEYWFYHSGQLVESPINILMKKELYKKLAVIHQIIKK